MKRRALVFVILAVAVAAGLGIYLWKRRGSGPPPYVTQKVTRGELAQVVSATGVVQPVVLSPVGSQVSGIVWKFHADWNDTVKKGQILVELDPALFDASVQNARANVQSAEAALQKAKAARVDAGLQVERARQLAEKRYIAAADRDTAEARDRQAAADVGAATAQVQQARAQLQRAELDRKNSVIHSPVDGVVIARNIEVGQAVVASFQAPNLYTIAGDLRHMQVLANVDEADIGMVQIGQAATFTVDAFRGRRFSAKVSQVRNAAQTVQNVVTYVVVLEVDNEDLLLKPGMTANVRMEVARRDNALLLPNAALRFKPRGLGGKSEGGKAGAPGGSVAGEGGKGEARRREWTRGGAGGSGAPGSGGRPDGGGASDGSGAAGGPAASATRGTAFLLVGGELKPARVSLGITDGVNTEVLEGLEEGQEVVVDTVRATPAGGPPNPMMPGGPPGGGPRGGGGGGMRRGGF